VFIHRWLLSPSRLVHTTSQISVYSFFVLIAFLFAPVKILHDYTVSLTDYKNRVVCLIATYLVFLSRSIRLRCSRVKSPWVPSNFFVLLQLALTSSPFSYHAVAVVNFSASSRLSFLRLATATPLICQARFSILPLALCCRRPRSRWGGPCVPFRSFGLLLSRAPLGVIFLGNCEGVVPGLLSPFYLSNNILMFVCA